MSGEFTAKSSADYLIIGNFFDDTNTKIATKEEIYFPSFIIMLTMSC
ncbi:MAG: hypothetical protein R2879_10185 [Saprospiraceae bacterium]